MLLVSCQVVLAANGRPVVVLNPKVPYMPFEMEAFEIAYQLRQYNVQPAKANPKAAKVREEYRWIEPSDRCRTLALGQGCQT